MPLICAHRGASGHAPENTLAAVVLAADQGAVMTEIDVQLSADGQTVVIHDETLDRTTTGNGPVADHTLAQLQDLDAGSWFGEKWNGEKIPTLAEIITAVGGRLKLNIELKGAAGPELEAEVVRIVGEHDFADRCLLTSFDHARIDRLDAHFRQGYIIGKEGWRWKFLEAPVQVLSLEQSLVDGELVLAAHRAGKEVHVWTVNDPADMKRMISYSVDAIITNYPDRLKAIRYSR